MLTLWSWTNVPDCYYGEDAFTLGVRATCVRTCKPLAPSFCPVTLSFVH